MKWIRLAVFSFLLLFGVIWAITLFIPSNVRISRAVEINAPLDSVRAALANPARWPEWYPNLDSATLIYSKEQPGARGVRSAAHGRVQSLMLDSVSGEEVSTLYHSGTRSAVTGGWTLHGKDPISVQWYMDFHLRWYPWEKFASLLFDKNYGTMMEAGLRNLKRQLEESQPDARN